MSRPGPEELRPIMKRHSLDRRGAALFMTLLISIAIAGIALGGILLASAANLTTKYNSKEALLQASADGGLEIARDSLNHGIFDTLLPTTGYTTLASSAAVTDASGNTLPRISMSLYVGHTGGRTGGAATAGQYGSNFASALSVISDTRGAVAARRMLMTQESWAKFAVAINNWAGVGYYDCDESVNGPFFSNDGLKLNTGCTSPKTIFSSSVNVVGSITNPTSGSFAAGYSTGVTALPWPTPAKLALMQTYAQNADVPAASKGDYDLISATTGNKSVPGPGLRIEFLPIDVNGNGVYDADEGYMRVWFPKTTVVGVGKGDTILAYATARRWPNDPLTTTARTFAYSILDTNPNLISHNCGAKVQLNGLPASAPYPFRTAADVYTGVYAATGGSNSAKAKAAALKVDAMLIDATRACYLGGDPHLFAVQARRSATRSHPTRRPPCHAGVSLWLVEEAAQRRTREPLHQAFRRSQLPDSPRRQPQLQGRHLRHRRRGDQREAARARDRGRDRQHLPRRRHHLRQSTRARNAMRPATCWVPSPRRT